jgi:membrane-bound serine protease (ClpP class)
MAALSAAVLIVLLGFTMREYRRPASSGVARLIGTEVQVLDWSGSEGHVWAESERWAAIGTRGLAAGERARVCGLRGLTLVVERTPKHETTHPHRRKGDR